MPDLGSFRTFYEAHVGFVWRALRRLGIAEADAADAAQEVFLVAHRRLAEFEGRSAPTTWLFGIALRVVSDRRRRADVRRQVLDDGSVERVADEVTDGDRTEERLDASQLLERALDRLPLEQRAVVVLFELEGMTSAEIGEAVGCPLGTVHSRLRLGREAFQRAVEALRRPVPQGGPPTSRKRGRR